MSATCSSRLFRSMASTGELDLGKGIEEREASIARLSDMVARYTVGLGLFEVLLSDDRIEDVYVDAPSWENPVHVTVNGIEANERGVPLHHQHHRFGGRDRQARLPAETVQRTTVLPGVPGHGDRRGGLRFKGHGHRSSLIARRYRRGPAPAFQDPLDAPKAGVQRLHRCPGPPACSPS